MTKQITWDPEAEITITGRQLESLFRVGEAFARPLNSVPINTWVHIISNFQETKNAITAKLLEEGVMVEVEAP